MGRGGMSTEVLFVSSPLNSSSFKAILKVIGLSERVSGPALFHVFVRYEREI